MDEKQASIALEDNENMEDDYEEKVNRHCCCGCLCDKSQWIMRQQQQEGEINEGCWFEKKAKKLRQILEWNNFIGRFCIHGICNKKKNKRRMQFHYDPQSYALNFDDGYYNNRELDGPPLGDFAARFTAPHQTTDDIA